MTVNIINRYITFYKAIKIMEKEYERCLKYREDYYPENYNKQLTCWDCGVEKNRRLFPYRKQYKYNKEQNNIVKNNDKELELKIEKLKIIIKNLLKEKDRLEKQVLTKDIEIRELSDKIPKNKCIDCNIGIDKTSIRCHNCNCRFIVESNKKNSKRPPYDQLLKDKEELKSNVKIGKKYDVSDNAVRKWFKTYEKYKKN